MTIKSLWISLLVWLFSFQSIASADHHATTASAELPATVVDIAVWSDVHSTFVAAVVAADLAETLSSAWPFTVFAPVNDAFAKLPAGTVETLLMPENIDTLRSILTYHVAYFSVYQYFLALKVFQLLMPENIDTLRSILTYHVVPGRVMASDLTPGMVAWTVQWQELTFTHANSAWHVNNATIIAADLLAGNGVIHVIDEVLQPAPEAELPATVVDIAVWSDVHSTLVAAVVAADLAGTLSLAWPFTVFAPVNDAFAKLPAGTIETLLMPENIDTLRSILTYHVVSGKVMAWNLSQGLIASTVQGDELTFTNASNKWYVNSAEIIATDLVAENGVIHVTGGVLLPPLTDEQRSAAVSDLRSDIEDSLEARVNWVLSRYTEITATLSEEQKMLLHNRFILKIDMVLEKSADDEILSALLLLLKYELISMK